MKKFFEFIGLWAFAFALIFFDAWCYMIVYNNGVWPLLASLQIYPPALMEPCHLLRVACFIRSKMRSVAAI